MYINKYIFSSITSGHCWRSGHKLKVIFYCGHLHMDEQKQDDQL